MFERVPELGLINKAVHNFNIGFRRLKCSKYSAIVRQMWNNQSWIVVVAPVPDDEDPRVVAVQAEPVGAVVDAVVGRGVEHPVQRAQARDQLGVDPGTHTL